MRYKGAFWFTLTFMAFFLSVVGVEEKKNKNASGKTFILLIISYSSTLHCLRSFIAWSLHIVHEKKRKFSFKKKANLWNICSWNLQSKTSFPFTADAFPASEKDIIVIHDVWSYLCPIIRSIKGQCHNLLDNGAIPWTVTETPWVTWHHESYMAEKRLYTRTLLQNIPPTKNLQCRNCVSLRWVSMR